MVKIFPARFTVENETVASTQLWDWVNSKIKDSKVTQIVPQELERNASRSSYTLKGLLEVHCSENITTTELASLLQPYPSFIQEIRLSFN